MDTEKTPSKKMICRDKHPTMIKLMKVFDLMEELGLSISFHGSTTTVQDDEFAATVPFFWLEDVNNRDQPMEEFPPATEFCLLFTNPVYITHQKKLAEEHEVEQERQKILAEQKKNEKSKKDAQLVIEREAERIKIEEEKEKKLFQRLKDKYESA